MIAPPKIRTVLCRDSAFLKCSAVLSKHGVESKQFAAEGSYLRAECNSEKKFCRVSSGK